MFAGSNDAQASEILAWYGGYIRFLWCTHWSVHLVTISHNDTVVIEDDVTHMCISSSFFSANTDVYTLHWGDSWPLRDISFSDC